MTAWTQSGREGRLLTVAVMLGSLLALGMPLRSLAAQADTKSADSAMEAAKTPANANRYVFADLAWGSKLATVKARLADKGFTFVRVDEDGDVWFRGKVSNYTAQVVCLMSPKRGLVKVIVRLLTPDADARTAFESMAEALVRKYGAPDIHRRDFDEPYYAGDGFEDSALQLGKAHFVDGWFSGEDTKGNVYGMMIEISQRLTVDFTYEGPQWSADRERRQDASADVF